MYLDIYDLYNTLFNIKKTSYDFSFNCVIREFKKFTNGQAI
jgi:hypothetical protein